MTDALVRCTICSRPAEHTDPFVSDGFYEGVQIHLHCLNAPQGRAWAVARAAEDPAYARYLELITVGRPVACPGCGAEGRVSPKAYGMSAGKWELNCTACHRHAVQLNAYRSPMERDVVQRLERLRAFYVRSADRDRVRRDLARLAAEVSEELVIANCECGGAHAADAPPRCINCAAVLDESPFHISLRVPA